MAARVEDDVLLRTARLVVGVSVRAADQIGEASLVQLRALTVISDAGEANLVQLAEGMGVTVSTTSRLVDRLIAAGLVDRRPSEVTRREVSISLTDTGRAVLQRYDDLRVQALRVRLDQLGPEQRAAAVAALADLVTTTAPGAEAATLPG